MESINWLAVGGCGLAAMILGGLWYAPLLFGKTWMAGANLTEAELQASQPAKVYGLSFLLALLSAAVFALFLRPAPALPFALGAGASAGSCWVAASFGVNYLFEQKPLKLFMINGGYHTVQFTLYGLILGLWH